MIDTLKRYGEIAAGVMAMGALFAGVLALFGAQIPPWTTAVEGQTIIQKIDKSKAILYFPFPAARGSL